MSKALRIIRLIENATEPREPQEPDPAGDKEHKGQKDFYGNKPHKANKSYMLDGSYEEEPGFYIGCPKCGEIGSNRQPKGDVRDTLCHHCEEPLVIMGSVDSKAPADKDVVQRGKERERRTREKAKRDKSKTNSRKAK